MIVLKVTLWLVAAWGAAWALRRASAALRHLVLTAALGGALLLPLTAQLIPWRAAVLPATLTPSPRERSAVQAPAVAEPGLDGTPPPAASAFPEGVPGPGQAEMAAGPTPERRAPREDGASTGARRSYDEGGAGGILRLAVLLWAAGMAGVLAWTGWGMARLRRIRGRASTPGAPAVARHIEALRARLGIARPVAVRESREVEVPMVVGLREPAVLLPHGAADRWPPSRLEAVLSHELAHVRRLDAVSHLVHRLACAFHWYNPLAWVVARRARREGERACDDLALAAGARPSAYARELVTLARAAGRASRVPAAGLPMARPSDLEGRVLAILEPDTDRRPPNLRAALAAAGLALGGLLALAAAAPAPPQATATGAEAEAPAAGASARAPEAALRRLTDLLGDPHPGVRAAAATSLGRLRAAEAVPGLVARLDDPSSGVRKSAARALGRIGGAAALERLARLLAEDPKPRVQKAAAWALGEMRSGAAVAALTGALEAGVSARVREHVVRALGDTRQAAAVPALARFVAHEEERMRRAALEALAENRSAEAAAVLVKAMGDPDPEVREAAARALGRR